MTEHQAPWSDGEVLAGVVERVTFHNAESDFAVLRVKARGHGAGSASAPPNARACCGPRRSGCGDDRQAEATEAEEPRAAAALLARATFGAPAARFMFMRRFTYAERGGPIRGRV